MNRWAKTPLNGRPARAPAPPPDAENAALHWMSLMFAEWGQNLLQQKKGLSQNWKTAKMLTCLILKMN